MRFAYCALHIVLNYAPPPQLHLKPYPRIGWAGAGERDDLNGCTQLFGNVSFKQGRCRAAVEVNGGDARVCREQANDVIGDDGVGLNRTVQAAVAFGVSDDVPEGDALAFEHINALWVGQGLAVGEQGFDDAPEGVVRVGVVLLFGERGDAGQGAEDERNGRFVRQDAVEALNHGGFQWVC